MYWRLLVDKKEALDSNIEQQNPKTNAEQPNGLGTNVAKVNPLRPGGTVVGGSPGSIFHSQAVYA